MRYSIFFILFLLNFNSFGQKKEIDRSNYELLWEISRDDMPNSSYLFGTYHSNDNDVFEFPDTLYPILENADAVVLETDITEMMLDEDIAHNQLDYKKSNLLHWLIPARGVDNVTYTLYGSDNGRPQFIDMYFKQVADNCKKNFIPLETIQSQMVIGINNEYNPDAPSNLRILGRDALKRKYLEGNAHDLHKYTRNSTLQYVDLYKDLIVDRNINMTEGIDTILHQNNSTFIAVGAAHLLGPQGIVPLLREKGYTVEVLKSKFTPQSVQKQKLLKKCTHYEYIDERYGASISFTGKPATMEYSFGGGRIAKYLELGQGNTYSLGMYHYNYKTNLDSIVMSYFDPKEFQITSFDSLMIDGQTKAYQGKVKYDGGAQWMRVFHKNNIIYEIYAFGGHRFMNSNRAINFFNSFKFIDFDRYGEQDLVHPVVSPSKTMRLNFPKGAIEETRQQDYDQMWTSLWFNPTTDETFFVLESIMTDNTIFYKSEDFGHYLLREYNIDSIEFSNQIHKEGEYLQKSFAVQDRGKIIYGKIRVLGNLIQLVEYTGEDEARKEQFLSDFDAIQPFPSERKETKISNSTFSTTLTHTGFKKQKVSTQYKYRNTNEYVLNDINNSLTYHVLIKDFHSWAFSQKSSTQLLDDQISWPEEELGAIVDTTYDLTGQHPTLFFDIYYPSSENRFVGKTMVIGKSIVVASITYPNLAHEAYQNLSFLDSLSFSMSDSIAINEISVPFLKNELMVNGEEAIEQLIEDGHINKETLLSILEWTPNFFKAYDPIGSLQGTALVALNDMDSTTKVIEYWEENVNSDNFILSLAALYVLQERNQPEQFITVAKKANELGHHQIDYYYYIKTNKDQLDFLKATWPVFSPLLEDSLAWNTSFVIQDLMKDDFFYEYFTSTEFIQAITSQKQPSWAPFRYMDILHEQNVPKEKLLEVLTAWGKHENDDKIGSIAAWKTILNEKITFREKRLIKRDAAVAISFSKVMAISNTPVFKLLTYEDMIGYLSFDHYKDAYTDKSKSLSHIENRVLSVDGAPRSFAFYKAIENGRTYFMARELFPERTLPSYSGFGNDTYFLYGNEIYQPKKIEEELRKKISE